MQPSPNEQMDDGCRCVEDAIKDPQARNGNGMNESTPLNIRMTHRLKRLLRQHCALPITLIALAGTCTPVLAQETPAPQPNEPAQQPAEQPPVQPAQPADQEQQPQLSFAAAREPDFSEQQRLRLVRVLTRTVLMDLRMNAEPSKDDYTLAAILLKDISSIVPNDAQVIRRWIEAAHAAGDEDMVMEATRALVKVDPSDTVAQLRLLTKRFSQIQIAKDRLSAYEQFLDKASAVDASVRSRISLDAALLARDIGNEEKFVALLTKATQLDSTNKPAAFLAYVYFSQRSPDDMGRLELLSNLLMADPLDASVHVQIRDLLASRGSWSTAERFHSIASRILNAKQATGIEQDIETLCLQMNSRGAPKALESVTQRLTLQRDAARAVFEQKKKNDEALAAVAPEDVRLDIPLEECRLVAAHASDDRDALNASITDMGKTAALMIEILQDATRRPADIDEATAQEEVIETIYRLTMWRLLTNVEVDFAKSVVTQVSEKMAADDLRRERFTPWVSLRSGDAQSSLTQSQELIDAEKDDEWTLVCNALAHEATGNTSEAAARLRTLSTTSPLTPLGAWAHWKASTLSPQSDSQIAKSMALYCRNTIPQWMDLMITNVDGFERLSATQPFEAEVLSNSALTISLRNTSPIPLGLGADRTINSRLLVGPRLDGTHQLPNEFLQPEVLEANQRLRLMPGEELKVSFWPSETSIGWAIDSVCDQTSRLRFRTLQGFEIDKDGIRQAGEGCQDFDANTMSIPPLEDAHLDAPALTERVLRAGEARIPALLLASRLRLATIAANPNANMNGPDVQNLMRAWSARYAGSAPILRAMILCDLPGPTDMQMTTVMDDIIRQDPDAFAQRWVIMTRVADPEDPALTAALTSADPVIARVAELQKSRLTSGQKTFSKYGVKGLLPSEQKTEDAPAATPAPATK